MCIARALARPLNRLLRHGVSGLGVLGGTGAQCAAHGKRQRGGGALRYHGLMHLFSFSALEHGGASRGFHAPVLSFLGCKATLVLFYPVPVGNTGTSFQKAVKSTAYLFPCLFGDIELISF